MTNVLSPGEQKIGRHAAVSLLVFGIMDNSYQNTEAETSVFCFHYEGQHEMHQQ